MFVDGPAAATPAAAPSHVEGRAESQISARAQSHVLGTPSREKEV